jgi:hypothetical protein
MIRLPVRRNKRKAELSHSPLGDGIESNRGEEAANVVRQFHEVFHEIMMTGQKQDWQSQSISWNGNHRFEEIAQSMFPMPKCVSATEQRAMNHEAPGPSGGRNDFIDNGFIAPQEAMPTLHHSSKEILVLAAHSELGAERPL